MMASWHQVSDEFDQLEKGNCGRSASLSESQKPDSGNIRVHPKDSKLELGERKDRGESSERDWSCLNTMERFARFLERRIRNGHRNGVWSFRLPERFHRNSLSDLFIRPRITSAKV